MGSWFHVLFSASTFRYDLDLLAVLEAAAEVELAHTVLSLVQV